MKILVTGATGFVGQAVVHLLAEEGQAEINALVRAPEQARLMLPAAARLFQGDIGDESAVAAAMEGCEFVFHLAALTKPWAKDDSLFYQVNVEGTRTVMNAALQAGVRRVVVTSTAGVMGAAKAGVSLVNEESNPQPELISIYDKTKKEAEDLSLSFLSKGLEVVIVNPTRIYGPGVDRESNSVTRLLRQFSQGRWRIIPGDGSSIGNYVFIEDVARGHLLAMERGGSGERYILGGENASYNEFFAYLREATGSRHRLFHAPLKPIGYFVKMDAFLARIMGRAPLLSPDYFKKLSLNWPIDTAKAEREIGYAHIPLKEGLAITYRWLKEKEG